MERVPEPELMLEGGQALAYATADFEEPHSRFIALLQERLPHLPAVGCALDLGCGPGDITRRFARAFPGWAVDAIDGSPAMIEIGYRTTAEAGLTSRIRFHEVFLPTESMPHDCYGLIFSNSLLHHLHDPAVLWSSLQRWANPQTNVFVMDLLRPAHRAEAHALVEHYAGSEPEILRNDFFNSLLAAYRPSEVRNQLGKAGLGHLKLAVISDRHFIVWGTTHPADMPTHCTPQS